MKKIFFFAIAILYFALNLSAQPAGAVFAYSGDITGLERDSVYMHCDGRLLRIRDYPKLFKAIGWNYLNSGDTINREYFRLPDYRGYFLRGVDTDGKIDLDKSYRKNLKGEIIGAMVGSVQTDSFKSHHHTITDPGHNHDMRNDNLSNGRKSFDGAEVTMFSGGQSGKPLQKTGITVNDEGGSETRPKNISVFWIIKVN